MPLISMANNRFNSLSLLTVQTKTFFDFDVGRSAYLCLQR